MARKAKNLLIASAIGLGVGYALGVLSAPKSGKETREDLKNAAGRFKEEVEKRYHETQASLSQAIDDAMSQVSDFQGSAKEKLQNLVDQAKQAEYKVKDIYRAVKHGETSDRNLDKAIDQANKAKENLFKYLNK